jgi:hypothetical protein
MRWNRPVTAKPGSCSVWEVYDEYLQDAERQRAEEAAKPKGGARRLSTAAAGHAAAAAAPSSAGAASGGSTLQGPAAEAGGGGPQAAGATVAGQRAVPAATHVARDGDAALSAASPAVAAAAAILDRMVVQNALADVAMDFKYWDDATDSFRWRSRPALAGSGLGRRWAGSARPSVCTARGDEPTGCRHATAAEPFHDRPRVQTRPQARRGEPAAAVDVQVPAGAQARHLHSVVSRIP